MSAVSALSVAPSHAFDVGNPGTERGVDGLAQAPATAVSHSADGFAMQRADRTRPAVLAGASALEARGRGTVQGVKMVTGYDQVTRQMRRGELVTVQRPGAQPAFWLRGGGTHYRLLAADGQPITALKPAEARAHQLIGSGAAARLQKVHLSSAGGVEFKAPADRTSPRIWIDLESPDINVKGGQGQARFGPLGTRLGEKGSALSSAAAVARARDMGILVKVTNDTPEPPETAGDRRRLTDEKPKGSPENAR